MLDKIFEHHFPHYKSMGCFLDNSVVNDQIWLKFKFIQDIMHVLINIATEIKWRHQFFRHSRATNSVVSGGIWPKFEHTQAFMHVLVTCKNEEDPTLEWPHIFSIIIHWELSVAMESRVVIQSGPKPNAAFPPPQCCF